MLFAFYFDYIVFQIKVNSPHAALGSLASRILILCVRSSLMHRACHDAPRGAVTIFSHDEKRALHRVRLSRGWHFQLRTTLSIT